MNIVVIGLGSMGRRRIRLIQGIDVDVNVFGIDNCFNRCEQVEQEFGINCFNSITESLSAKEINSVFICTPPITHSAIILECLHNKLHVFTEINLLADKYDEIIKLANKNQCKLFLSSTMLYRKEIQKIIHSIPQTRTAIRYHYHVGQYLPDWHPWESYKDFFAGDKQTNGCREIFAIELPWMIEAFGKIIKINVFKDKVSDLEIDYPDTFLLMAEHESGVKGTFAVDVISRKPVRNLEIYSPTMHLFWDGTPRGLSTYDVKTKKLNVLNLYKNVIENSDYADYIIEDAYIAEIETFFNILNGDHSGEKYTINNDMYTLGLIDDIEAK